MRHHFNYHHSINWKWSILWVLIHFVSLLLLTLGIEQLSLTNSLVIIFILGFGVTIISRIVRIFTLKKRFIVDKWFFFWSLINTFTIWLILLLTSLLQITNNLTHLIFTALALVIVAYFVKKLRITKRVMIITSIILIIILFFFSSSSINLKQNINQVIDIQSSTQEKISDVQVQSGTISSEPSYETNLPKKYEIKEIILHKDNYVGRYVIVEGNLRWHLELGYVLEGKDDYLIWLSGCIDYSERDYDEGRKYTAEGFFRKDAVSTYGSLDTYHLECSKKLY